jgi:hypothetical protein
MTKRFHSDKIIGFIIYVTIIGILIAGGYSLFSTASSFTSSSSDAIEQAMTIPNAVIELEPSQEMFGFSTFGYVSSNYEIVELPNCDRNLLSGKKYCESEDGTHVFEWFTSRRGTLVTWSSFTIDDTKHKMNCDRHDNGLMVCIPKE